MADDLTETGWAQEDDKNWPGLKHVQVSGTVGKRIGREVTAPQFCWSPCYTASIERRGPELSSLPSLQLAVGAQTRLVALVLVVDDHKVILPFLFTSNDKIR